MKAAQTAPLWKGPECVAPSIFYPGTLELRRYSHTMHAGLLSPLLAIHHLTCTLSISLSEYAVTSALPELPDTDILETWYWKSGLRCVTEWRVRRQQARVVALLVKLHNASGAISHGKLKAR